MKFLLLFLLTLNSYGQSLFEQFPYNDSFTLKDGTSVELPFHVFDGTTTAILALNNSKIAKRFKKNKKFEIVSIPCQQDTGIAVLYLQNLNNTTVGAYNETVNTFMVKRKGAPDLNLPCLENTDDQIAVMQYLLGALQIMGAANQENASKGLPHDYAMYNQHLVLDNPLAVAAGKEIWGYPKVLGKVDYTITDASFKVDVASKRGKSILKLEYSRILSTPTPFVSRGDNVMPFNRKLHKKNHSQLDGILATQPGTVAYIMPFIGTFEVGKSRNLTAKALRKTQFKPYALVEFTNVEGVAFPLYKK